MDHDAKWDPRQQIAGCPVENQIDLVPTGLESCGEGQRHLLHAAAVQVREEEGDPTCSPTLAGHLRRGLQHGSKMSLLRYPPSNGTARQDRSPGRPCAWRPAPIRRRLSNAPFCASVRGMPAVRSIAAGTRSDVTADRPKLLSHRVLPRRSTSTRAGRARPAASLTLQPCEHRQWPSRQMSLAVSAKMSLPLTPFTGPCVWAAREGVAATPRRLGDAMTITISVPPASACWC